MDEKLFITTSSWINKFPDLAPDKIMNSKALVGGLGQTGKELKINQIPPLINPNLTQKPPYKVEGSDRILGIEPIEHLGNPHICVPVKLIEKHESVILKFGDKWYSISYCPLTDSAILYKGKWGTSGLLYNSNLVMIEMNSKKSNDHILMPQILGMVINGKDAGKFVEKYTIVRTSYSAWTEQHTPLFPEGKEGFDYSSESYPGYHLSNKIMFPITHHPKDHIKAHDPVLGVIIQDGPIGFWKPEAKFKNHVFNRMMAGKLFYVDLYFFAWESYFPKTLISQ